ncbi:uncharacterized protein LOC128681755 isoform X3 [Plodia interpunctella]|uniref:uncharacterized protein LOC128681755 isoform X3 n=1 Tax=Plodia interpunctella TaxID=58824 RepID=UPI0023683A48|nr:uncharacterized protein LOC128681755 isoform X3 [Plodia interpunctella]
MTCGVCQHCQESVSQAEGYAVHAGYSYHKKCHKCYVCSETDLHNAEVFKGVIFCSSCSQRIFQGCSTARRTKSGVRTGRRRSRSKSKARKRSCSPRKEGQRAKNPIPTGVIELAHLAASVKSSDDLATGSHDRNRKLEITTELALQVGKRIYEEPLHENDTWDTLKKESAEIGVTTEVTQDLLRQMKCPVIDNCEKKMKSSIPRRKPPKIIAKPSPSPHNTKCSDWRIAELGQSTEIANMVLKKKSELPVIIRSLNQLKKDMSPHLSSLNRESDESGDSNEDWLNSSRYERECKRGIGLKDVHIASFLKLPIRCFKRNILQRSSIIDMIISNEDGKNMFMNKIKNLFHEEIVDHQCRGVRRLYSTINRRKTPYRMGWLHVVPSNVIRMKHPSFKGCKHYKRSHSYRCMRSMVMRNAGPTKSDLAKFRSKLINYIVPHCLRNGFNFDPKVTENMREREKTLMPATSFAWTI